MTNTGCWSRRSRPPSPEVVHGQQRWLGRWRRLSKDYEHLPEVSEAMVTLAMIRLMVHRVAIQIASD